MHPSDKHLLKVLYRYSGVETICNKARVTEEQHPKKILPTLPLWLIGIYVATYGVASQRYENRVDIIENKVNTIYPQLTSTEPKTKEMAFRRIEIIQQMKCPYKPNVLNPISVYLSFLTKSKYEGVAELMKETIENWKGTLNKIDLSNLIFRNADLEGANLKGTFFTGADLSHANLSHANLEEAVLWGADLTGAVLTGAVLTGINLHGANLEGADFWAANLEGATLSGTDLLETDFLEADLEGADFWAADLRKTNFQGANLKGATNLTIDQLSKVATLYYAVLDPELMAQVKEKYPHLLEEPKHEEEKTDDVKEEW